MQRRKQVEHEHSSLSASWLQASVTRHFTFLLPCLSHHVDCGAQLVMLLWVLEPLGCSDDLEELDYWVALESTSLPYFFSGFCLLIHPDVSLKPWHHSWELLLSLCLYHHDGMHFQTVTQSKSILSFKLFIRHLILAMKQITNTMICFQNLKPTIGPSLLTEWHTLFRFY